MARINLAATPTTAPRCRALLVEDDANESHLLASYLRSHGIEVTTAADGLAALEELAHGDRPDIVLLDMHMPRLGGKATIERIRQDPRCRDLKIFGVSGLGPQECGVQVGPAGVDHWFCKPLNPEKLVQQIKDGILPPSTSA